MRTLALNLPTAESEDFRQLREHEEFRGTETKSENELHQRHLSAKKGFEPPADMNYFHGFIKNYLHVDVSMSQLRDKVRRLKKKYQNNARRGKKSGDPKFTKPHERKAFELARKVWGGEIESPLKEELLGMPENVKENDKMHADISLAPSESLNELLDFNKNPGVVEQAEYVVNQRLKLIEGSKKAEFNEQWIKLHYAALELFVRRTELASYEAILILETYKSSSK